MPKTFLPWGLPGIKRRRIYIDFNIYKLPSIKVAPQKKLVDKKYA
jgi:hypothetical protein